MPQHSQGQDQAAPPRLGWLDALRGVAVLFVLYEHLTFHVLGALRTYTGPWFNAGQAGVFLFFVISGYIVPASLERRGSLRRFWVSRIFRLYPLVIVGTAGAVVLGVVGIAPFDPVAVKQSWATAIASTTMLQDLLRLPSVPAVLWSLSYEMIFYLLISALFVFGLHRLSAEWAILWAAVAAGTGGLLPVVTLSALGLNTRAAAILMLVAVVVGLGGLMSGRRSLVIAGALVVGVLAVTLLATSEQFPNGHLMSIPAAMFAGTAIYRVEQKQISWRKAGPMVGLVFLFVVVSAWWALPDWSWKSLLASGWRAGALTLAAALFAVGMRLRHRRFPAPLVKLGLISYSVYVLHFVLLLWLQPTLDLFTNTHLLVQASVAMTFIALVLIVSAGSYRLIELPAQAFGRRAGRKLDALLGPDAPPVTLPSQRRPAESATVGGWPTSPPIDSRRRPGSERCPL